MENKESQTREEKKLAIRNDKVITPIYMELRKKYPQYEENFKDDKITQARDWQRANKRLVRAFTTLRANKTLQKRDIVLTLEPIIQDLSNASQGEAWN